MKNQKKIYVLQHTVYTLLLLLLYVLQTIPALFSVYGVKPFWVVPAAVAIAMFEGEFAGGVYGAAAGILCDMGGFSLFGFNGFFIAVCCISVGLLVIYLMRCNLMGCLLFVFLTLLLRGSVEYFFAFGMWGYDNVGRLYTQSTLPTIAYSLLVTPLVYGLIKGIHRRFQLALRD